MSVKNGSITLLRNDLATFIQRAFLHLNPGTPYVHNWHIDLIADRLMQVYDGRIKRLIINVPPRSLKSVMASVAFPAWLLARDPTRQIINVSYGQELSDKLARDCLALVQSAWYQRMTPTRLAKRAAAADFETTLRGGRMATSVGGTLTGRGGDILIIDDPVKPDEALSDVQRNAANLWFDNTLYSRLNDRQTGAIVIIMQRLHLDDLVGHVLDKEAWEVINLPAIAEEVQDFHYHTLAGPRSYRREMGDFLHPGREGQAELDALRETLGPYAFSAQYQQSPVPQGGGIVKTDWLHFYEDKELPERFDKVIQSWDTANKASELADYSVCTTWGLKGKTAYLRHVLRKRMDYPELKRAVIEQQKQWDAHVVLIEDKASGTQLIQELSQQSLRQVKGIKPLGDKEMRLLAQTPMIENGGVRFPRHAPWWEVYAHELTAFPVSKFKDQVDSTSQALEWISASNQVPGMIRYYREETAKRWNCTEEEVIERMERERPR